MGKNWMKVAMAVFILVLSFSAWGIAPAAIHVSYDLVRQELLVTVQHPVTDRFEHYISEVIISKNGAEIAREDFDFQTSRRDQTMPPFKIPAKSGDVFKIVAVCNGSESGEASLTVPTSE